MRSWISFSKSDTCGTVADFADCDFFIRVDFDIEVVCSDLAILGCRHAMQ
jgi:hypothetical protein